MQRKGPLPGKIFTWCILQRRFAGLFGYMARISCQSQLILNTRRRYIATKGPFSRPRPFWDTPGQNIAIVRHPGTHNVNISPPPGAWECISRAYAAMPDRPMTHRGSTSSAKPPFGYARGSMLVPTVPPPEPIREMRRCPAAAVGTAAMKELGHRRAAYWGGGRDIDARRLPGAREGHRRAPSAGCGGALTHGLPGVRGPSAAGSQPAGAWSRLGRGTY